MKVSAENPTSSPGFLLWGTSNLDLWPKTPSNSWHARGEAHAPSVHLTSTPLQRCELPSAKVGQPKAHFKVCCRSELISSKDFHHIDVTDLMYLKYFQFKMVKMKLI